MNRCQWVSAEVGTGTLYCQLPSGHKGEHDFLAVPFHCGNDCPVPDDQECRQVHWCGCCGDCQYCYSEPCYDGCSIHGYQLESPR